MTYDSIIIIESNGTTFSLFPVYGMTLGFPTIVIPAIQGGEGREPSDIILSRDQISWFSKFHHTIHKTIL